MPVKVSLLVHGRLLVVHHRLTRRHYLFVHFVLSQGKFGREKIGRAFAFNFTCIADTEIFPVGGIIEQIATLHVLYVHVIRDRLR